MSRRLIDQDPTRIRFSGSPQLLVAEDVEMNRRVVKRLLKSLDLHADFAENGRTALKMLASHSYDLLLLDCSMPIQDGYQTVEILRRKTRFQKLPVIAMTANVSEENRKRCFESGMNDFLPKPVTFAKLVKTLSRWLPVITQEAGLDIVDHTMLESLDQVVGGGLKAELIDLLPQTGERYLAGLRAAIDSDSRSEVARQAHGLKSAICYFGASRLARLCTELEAEAETLERETLTQKYEEALRLFRLLVEATGRL